MRLSSLCCGCCLLLLAGCVTQPAKPEREPAGGRGGEVVALPTQQQRLHQIALHEWHLWGRGVVNATDDEPDSSTAQSRWLEHDPRATTRVLLYWFFLKGSDFPAESALHPDGSLQAWSAVFISYLMQAAGIPRHVFPSSIRHWDYIRWIHDQPSPDGFEALDAASAAPRVGDVICAPRSYTATRVSTFAQLGTDESNGAYHCDLVVQVEDGRVGAIGGNVLDGVTWTRIATDVNGLLQKTDQRPWLVVLRNHLR